jgi:hypothetical protein
MDHRAHPQGREAKVAGSSEVHSQAVVGSGGTGAVLHQDLTKSGSGVLVSGPAVGSQI